MEPNFSPRRCYSNIETGKGFGILPMPYLMQRSILVAISILPQGSVSGARCFAVIYPVYADSKNPLLFL